MALQGIVAGYPSYYAQYAPGQYDAAAMPAPRYDPAPADSAFKRKLMELDAQIQEAQRAPSAPASDPFCPRWSAACDPFPSLWAFPSAVARAPIAPAARPPARDFSPSTREYEPPGAARPPPARAPEGAPLPEKPPADAEGAAGSRKPSKRRKANRSGHRGNG
jgi:hypothetical protein